MNFEIIFRFGEYRWKDGRTYIGSWLKDKMDGEKGTYTWPDGKQYYGDFKNGFKHGYGEFTWASGKVYKGTWNNGKMHGDGEISHITEDSYSYRGSFIGGKLYSKKDLEIKEEKSILSDQCSSIQTEYINKNGIIS